MLTEGLAHVPSGAKISFGLLPSDSDGRSASWKLGSLKSGEAMTVGYIFNARMTASEAESIRQPSISSQPPKLALFAPSASKVGGRVTLSLQTLSGKPMPGTLITVGYPDGTSQEMRTDYRGKVSFNAQAEGYYTYTVRGFGLERMVSTEVLPREVLPVISAAMGLDKEIVSFFTGLLPTLAVIFGLAVLALIIYNFFNSREEEEQQSESPSEPPAQYYSPPAEAPAYTQKFTFADSGESDDQKMRDLTRGLVESRKKQMQVAEVSEEEPQHNNRHSYGQKGETVAEREPAGSEEADEEDAEVERELEKLEAQARGEGEVTEQEDEIESAIAELEEIRKKLRERRDQVLEIEEKFEHEGRAEIAPPRKPVPRVMPPRERVEPTVPPVKKK